LVRQSEVQVSRLEDQPKSGKKVKKKAQRKGEEFERLGHHIESRHPFLWSAWFKDLKLEKLKKDGKVRERI